MTTANPNRRRRLRYAAIVLIACVLAAVAIPLVRNSLDEELSADASWLLAAPQSSPVPPEDNGFVAMAGFEAPPGQSIVASGTASIETLNRESDALLKNPGKWDAPPEVVNPDRLQFKGVNPFCMADGHPTAMLSWPSLAHHEVEVVTLLRENQELYRRYIQVQGMHGYFTFARDWSTLHDRFIPRDVRCLFLANAALRLESGNHKQQSSALADLRSDISHWRTVVTGTATYTTVVLAMYMLEGDEELLIHEVNDPRLNLVAHFPELDALTAPFDLQDWKLGKAVTAQYRTEAFIVLHMADEVNSSQSETVGKFTGFLGGWPQMLLAAFENHFFRPNATENLLARQWRLTEAMADSEPAQFNAGRDKFDRFNSKYVYNPKDSVKFLPGRIETRMDYFRYNPVGRFVVSLSTINYADTEQSAYDIAALQRLAHLMYEIHRQGVVDADIPRFLASHPALATHPLDGQAFLWNPATREIAIQALSPRSKDHRFKFTLDSAE
jgi:hypothetical protein